MSEIEHERAESVIGGGASRRSARARSVALGAIVALVAMSVWGCGSGGKGDVVASVEGVPITKASLEHWMRVWSVVSYKAVPTEPAPKGVLPDPPSYSACVAWLGSATGPLESRSLPAAQHKTLCKQRLGLLKKKALEFLLVDLWDMGEIKAQGIKIPQSELQQALKRLLISEGLDKGGRFGRFLSATGMTEADMLVMQRITVYGDKINKEIFAKPHPAEMRRALVGFAAKWVAKTSCQAGYVVPGCRQYHGPESPP